MRIAEFTQTTRERQDFALCLPRLPSPSPGEACGQTPVGCVNFAHGLSHSQSSHSVQGFATDHENTQEIQTLRQCVWNKHQRHQGCFSGSRVMCRVMAVARGAFLAGFSVSSWTLLSNLFLTGDPKLGPCMCPLKEQSKWSKPPAENSRLCPTLHQEPIPGGNK